MKVRFYLVLALLSLVLASQAWGVSTVLYGQRWFLLAGTTACIALLALSVVSFGSKPDKAQRWLTTAVAVSPLVLAVWARCALSATTLALMLGWSLPAILLASQLSWDMVLKLAFLIRGLPFSEDKAETGWKLVVSVSATIHPMLLLLAAATVLESRLVTGHALVWNQTWRQVVHQLRPGISLLWAGPLVYLAVLFTTVFLLFTFGSALRDFQRRHHADSSSHPEELKSEVVGIYQLSGWTLITSVFLVGFAEEVVFRGILQPVVGFWAAATIFAVGHFENRKQLLRVVLVGAAAAIYGMAVIHYGNLWPAIIGHALFNAHPESLLLKRLQRLVAPTKQRLAVPES